MSELNIELYKALAAFQNEIGPISKDSSNPAFGGSKYASLSSFISACQPILNKHGLLVHFKLKNGGLTARLVHIETGQYEESTAPIMQPEIITESAWTAPAKQGFNGSPGKSAKQIKETIKESDPQSFGAALTYAKRQMYQTILGVNAEEDDDGNRASRGRNSNGNSQPSYAPVKCPKCGKMTGAESQYESDFYCKDCKHKWNKGQAAVVEAPKPAKPAQAQPKPGQGVGKQTSAIVEIHNALMDQLKGVKEESVPEVFNQVTLGRTAMQKNDALLAKVHFLKAKELYESRSNLI